MAFTLVTVTGSYGPSASGQLTFTVTQPMANADQIVLPAPVVVTLDDDGSFSVALQANTDPPTTPQGVVWGVTEQIVGAQPRDYFIEVPAIVEETDGTTIDDSNVVALSSLTGALWMAGLPIAGDGIPSETTIESVLQSTNQLTLSNPATANATGVTFTIGTDTLDISQLMPTQPAWA